MYSDFFINFMVHNMFCNLAAFVPFLLFLFWSLCFNKYIFYGTKGSLRSAWCVWLVLPWVAAKTRTQLSSAPFFLWCLFLFTNNIKIQFIYRFSPPLISAHEAPFCSISTLCLLVMFAGKKMELVALKVRRIWTTANAQSCSNQ